MDVVAEMEQRNYVYASHYAVDVLFVITHVINCN